jgi:hypothetical protein
VEAAATNSPIQQDDWSLSWKHSMLKHQESQQKPDIILSNVLMQETQIEVSNSLFSLMDPLHSPLYQFLEPEIDMFDTRDITSPFMSDTSPKDVDRAVWSGLLPFGEYLRV